MRSFQYQLRVRRPFQVKKIGGMPHIEINSRPSRLSRQAGREVRIAGLGYVKAKFGGNKCKAVRIPLAHATGVIADCKIRQAIGRATNPFNFFGIRDQGRWKSGWAFVPNAPHLDFQGRLPGRGFHGQRCTAKTCGVD